MNNTPSSPPPVSWLSMTNYMHCWLVREYGGTISLYGKPVLSIAHLPGARDILRMQTQDDVMEKVQTRWSLSAMRMDFLRAGVELGMDSNGGIEMKREQLDTFVPIECPSLGLTQHGVMRPWSRVTSFGQRQAFALAKLLRALFWSSIGEYEKQFTWPDDQPRTTIAMIEGFCQDTGTPDIYADDLRREWQRQCNTRRSNGG